MNTPTNTPTEFLANPPRGARLGSLALAAALALGLAACGKNDDRTAGQKLDSAIANTQQAADKAKADAQVAAANTAQAASDAATQAANAARDAGHKISAGAETAKDNASAAAAKAGEAMDDAGITAAVNVGLAKDTELSALKIDVDTKDGVVTLHGPAPSKMARDRATEIAKSVKGVKSVNNMLTLKAG